MDKMADIITKYLLDTGVISKDDSSIYRYGIQMGIELLASIIASLLIAVYLGMVPECIFFFAIFIPLRSYAGGIHLDKYWQCFLCSSGVLCVVLLLAKYVELNSASMLIMALIAIVLIQKIGPSGNKNRTLDYEEKVFFSARLQKASFGILIIMFVLWWFELNKYLLILLCTLWLVAVAMILSKITVCNQQCD